MVEPGKLRPSQIITTFGPGSIVNMEHDAIMLMGLHKWKDTWVYINQGTGYWGPPLRIGTEPEITEITLTA